LRRGDIAIDAAHFGAQRLQPGRDRAGSADQFGILRLECEATLFGGLEFLLALLELAIEEHQRIGDLAAIARDVLLAEDVEQFLDHVLRELGVLRIAQIALADGRADFEQIVLLALDQDVFVQAGDRALQFGIGGDILAQFRRADDLFEIDPAGQSLAYAFQFLLAVAGDFQLLREDVVDLHIDTRAAFVAVGDQRHHQPAEHADAPGHAQRDPAPVPDLIERRAQFLEDLVHSGCALRRPTRG
jgi:hypothetical protein